MNQDANNKWREALDKPVPQWDKNALWERIQDKLPPPSNPPFPTHKVLISLLSMSILLFGDFLHNRIKNHGITDKPISQMQDNRTQMLTGTISNPNKSVKAQVFAKTEVSLHQINPILEQQFAINQPVLQDKVQQYVDTEVPTAPLFTMPKVARLLPARPVKQLSNDQNTSYSIKAKDNKKSRAGSSSSWLTEVITGFAATDVIFKSNTAEGENFAEIKSKSERPLETFFVRSNVHFLIHPNCRIGTGIQFQQTTIWFKHDEVTTRETQVFSDSAQYYSYNGVNYFISGQTTETTTSTRKIQSPSRLQRLSVPLQLSFIRQQRRHQIDITAGLLVNFLSKYQGFALNTDDKLIEKNTTPLKLLYASKGIHAYYGSVNYGYHITPKLRIILGLFVQQDWRSMLRSSTGLDSRFRNTGVQVGIQQMLIK